MKKIAFFLLPVLALGFFVSPLSAKTRFSFSVNLHTFPSLFMAPPRHVIIHPVPRPVIHRQVIRKYYTPIYEEIIITQPGYLYCRG